MMQFLTEWVTNIILFILLATIIDLLLPNSNMQKYTKLVIGLLLIAVIMAPMLKLFSSNFESVLDSIPVSQSVDEQNLKNSIEAKKREIQANEHAYILEEIAVRLQKDAKEELMKRYGLEIASVRLFADEKSDQSFPENLQKVSVLLKQPKSQVKNVETIKRVEINIKEPQTALGMDAESAEIASFLSQKWDVSENQIEILIEGGKSQSDG